MMSREVIYGRVMHTQTFLSNVIVKYIWFSAFIHIAFELNMCSKVKRWHKPLALNLKKNVSLMSKENHVSF